MRTETPTPPLCMAFLLCDNPATKTRAHPVLGEYPICDRCDAKLDAIEAATRSGQTIDPTTGVS